jgi:hypothetical protein
MNETKRIPLKNNVTDDMIIAESRYNEWLWWNEISRTENTPYEIVFIKPGKKTSIHYIQDYLIKLHYIVAIGEEADKVIEEAKNSLDCYSWQEIVDYYDANKDDYKEKIGAVYLAGIAAPLEFSPEHRKFFDNSLQDEHPDVRIATIVAMGYMGWTKWIPVLQDLKNNDSDATVRDSAAGMIESFAANELRRSQQIELSTETEEANQPEKKTIIESLQEIYSDEQKLAQLRSQFEEEENQKLQQELDRDKQELAQLRRQLQEVEKQIEQNRRTNIFGRPQSGNDEVERDRLIRSIARIQEKIAHNESLLEDEEE